MIFFEFFSIFFYFRRRPFSKWRRYRKTGSGMQTLSSLSKCLPSLVKIRRTVFPRAFGNDYVEKKKNNKCWLWLQASHKKVPSRAAYCSSRQNTPRNQFSLISDKMGTFSIFGGHFLQFCHFRRPFPEKNRKSEEIFVFGFLLRIPDLPR